MWDAAFPYLAALLPTIAVSVLFFYIIKYILEGDRRERLAQSKWEREHGGQRPHDETGADSPPETPEH
ncbi:MAG: lysyl-tRNA synthetase [Actinomycetota bacterium]|nr:lysyl-tRNA synthetase [Actinomycetota bacterium]